MIGAKERGKIISACYKISENKPGVGLIEVARIEDIEEWLKARRAVDVAIFKAGIRLVVEWIEKNSYTGTVNPDDTGEMLRDLLETAWQSQKKVWLK